MALQLTKAYITYPAALNTHLHGRNWIDRLITSLRLAGDLFSVVSVIDLLDDNCPVDESQVSQRIELLLNGQSIWKHFGRVTTNGKPLACMFQTVDADGYVMSYGPVEMRTLNRQFPGFWFEFADMLAYHLTLCWVQKRFNPPHHASTATALTGFAPPDPLRYFPPILQFVERLRMAFKRRLMPNPNAVQWGIGLFDATKIGVRTLSTVPANMVWLDLPDDRFWADPVLTAYGDKVFMFYEELVFNEGVGRLCAVELPSLSALIERQTERQIESQSTVLEFEPPIDNHLSFPFVFESADQWYLIPENMQSGQTNLYQCKRFPDQWQLRRTLLPRVAGVDPIIFFYDAQFWLFVGDGAMGAQDNHLRLFYSAEVDGAYQEHPCSPIKLGLRGSRMAGPIVNEDGRLIRVAQDCSKIYGGSMVLFEINELNPTAYQETELFELMPDSASAYPLGVHSLCIQKGMPYGAIDGLRTKRHNTGLPQK